MNIKGRITGYYVDTSRAGHGFVANARGKVTTFDVPQAISTFGMSVNATDSITGNYADTSYVNHGFVRSEKGKITTFDPAGSGETYPHSINDAGEIAGTCTNFDGSTAGFVRNADGTITTFQVPLTHTAEEATTEVAGINADGSIAGIFKEDGPVHQGFVRIP